MEIQTGFPILQISAEKTKASGSLEYMGRCDGSPDFPNVHAPRNGGGPPLEIFRDVFSKDPMMRVKQDTSGKIRMVEADVPGDLLDAQRKQLRFGDDEWIVQQRQGLQRHGRVEPLRAVEIHDRCVKHIEERHGF